MTAIYSPDLQEIVARHRPQSILTVGPEAAASFADYLRRHPDCRLTEIDDADPLAALAGLGMHDLALVSATIEILDKEKGEALIASLRDQHARRLLLAVRIGAGWTGLMSTWRHTELIALGLGLVARYGNEHQGLHLYHYNIGEYKTTPDWLNPDGWAHPELWNKFRW